MTKSHSWEMKPHTAAKHQILKAYLQQWFAKLGKFGSLTYLDGFAGRGRYASGEDGSPIVALRALIEHSGFPSWQDYQFRFIFVEHSHSDFQQLEREVSEYLTSVSNPPNVDVVMRQGDFADTVQRLSVAGTMPASSPLLAFVDPFGYKAVPMQVIAPMVRARMSEVLINLSTDSINRFFEESSVASRLDALFGMPTEARLRALPGEERDEEIARLYIEQLKSVAGFRCAWKFGMEFPAGHIGYHLVFGSHSVEGLKAMKRAMWSVDPSGSYRFADRWAGQLVLFTGQNLDTALLRQALTRKFSGLTVPIEDIVEFTVEETPFLDSHVKGKTLKPMEEAGIIVRESASRKFTYPPGSMIRFV